MFVSVRGFYPRTHSLCLVQLVFYPDPSPYATHVRQIGTVRDCQIRRIVAVRDTLNLLSFHPKGEARRAPRVFSGYGYSPGICIPLATPLGLASRWLLPWDVMASPRRRCVPGSPVVTFGRESAAIRVAGARRVSTPP